jgi:type II secretion system protein L
MVESAVAPVIAAWDGKELAIAADGELHQAQPETEAGIPMPAGTTAVQMLLWPLEQLIVRPFALPLRHSRLLDHEILTQELQEQAGDAERDPWLCWQAEEEESGVAGLMFGLERQTKEILAGHDIWGKSPFIVPDGWVRLAACFLSQQSGTAIIDADREGLFAGVRRSGAWRGMRRINRAPWKSEAMLAEETVQTLRGMGFDTDHDQVTGRLPAALVARLQEEGIRWSGTALAEEELPGRHRATLDAAAAMPEPGINFRHGSWQAGGGWRQGVRPWRHTVLLAAALLLVLLASGGYRILTLHGAVAAEREAMTDAFHRGLPDETVMLDPLAQLRMAASSGQPELQEQFMQQLEHVARVHKSIAGWQVRHIEYSDGTMHLAGTAADFAMINRIREALAADGPSVQIEDTETEGERVRFRLKWS